MANVNNITEIPLYGEVCLNKNKIDITQFTGYSKKNGQLYGEVLSPLRYKNIESHNYYDKNGNNYDIINGEFKKNGLTVFNYDLKGIKKEILTEELIAYAHSNTEQIKIKQTSAVNEFLYEFSYNDISDTLSIADASIIRKVKAFCNDEYKYYGFVVWYISTTGTEKITVHYCNTSGTEFTKNTIISNIGVINPFIQVSVLDADTIFISCYSNKGTELKNVNVSNVVIKNSTLYNNVVLHYSGNPESLISLGNKKIKIEAQFEKNVNATQSSTVIVNNIKIKLSESYTSAIVVKHYKARNGNTVTIGTIAAGVTTLTETITDDDWFSTDDYLIFETLSAPDFPTTEERQAQTLINYTFNLYKENVYVYQNVRMGNLVNYNTSTSSLNSYFTDYAEIKFNYYEVSTLPINKEVDSVMDDGSFISCNGLNNNNGLIPESFIIAKGYFINSSVSGNTITINYQEEKKINFIYSGTENNPRYYNGVSFSLSDFNFKIVYSLYADEEKTKAKYLMYDIAENKLFFNAGVNKNTQSNNNGSCYSIGQNLRLLFNNNMLSGVSCCESDSMLGTLLIDWYSVADENGISVSDNSIVYMGTNGNYNKVSITLDTDWNYKVVEDRFIVINTISFLNCYDMAKNRIVHYANDWNNRIVAGIEIKNNEENNIYIYNMESANDILTASGINANFEITKNPLCSIQIGAQIFDNIILGNETVLNADIIGSNADTIDFYTSAGSESTVAVYNKSFKNNLVYKKPDLLDAYYPVATDENILFSPSLFSEFIKSYNNRDMVITDGTSYTLIYSNAQPVLLYQLLSGVDGMKNTFILQASYYGVSDKQIFELTYENGVIVSSSAICNIEGMQYLGAIPNAAYFWSPYNRTIYAFRGDAILGIEMQANEIEEIKNTAYNPASQELFVFADNNIIVISSGDMYKLEDFHNPKDIYFLDEFFIVTDDNGAYNMSYNALPEYKSYKLKITTKYYGIGNNIPVNFDCWYIRLSNDGIKESGSVVVKVDTITDKGFESEEKEIIINESDWDELTDSYYLRFQPSIQKAVGAALSIETEFPIVSLFCSYTSFDGAAQVSHNNL